jgi:hypothetical protein
MAGVLTRRRRYAAPKLWIVILIAGGCSPEQPTSDAKTDLGALEKKYGVRVVTRDVQPTGDRIHATACIPEELARYTPLFAAEFGLYPADVIRRAQLERIVLCKDLSYGGQLRGAIPDFEGKTLYLDAVRGIEKSTYLRKVIHHDFFHMIDYRDDGNLYSDKQWEALNPAGFHYGTGGANAQGDPLSSVLTDRYPGFLNSYSKTGVEEDKAEMFANLMVEPNYVERRCRSDSVVRTKVAALKRLLARFSAEVDEQFWSRVSAIQSAGPNRNVSATAPAGR